MKKALLTKSIVGALLVAAIFSSAAACAEELEENLAKQFPSYFISPRHIKDIKKGLSYVGEADKKYAQLFNFDFRGLKLGTAYEEVTAFEKKEGSSCQSEIANFYTFGPEGFSNSAGSSLDVNEMASAAISQGAFACKNGGFGFTPLGRLDGFTISFWSEEQPLPLMKRFGEKLPDIKWTYDCFDFNNRANNMKEILPSCAKGDMVYDADGGDTYTPNNGVALSYDIGDYDNGENKSKRFVDGKMQYLYTVSVNSSYLSAIDMNALGKVFIKNTAPAPTKM